MKIIAHRGYWKKISEKNTLRAISRAVEEGYGVETDVRDMNGNLVISHDFPSESSIKLDDALEIFSDIKEQVLALNIKSDGLSSGLSLALDIFNIENYFTFDMSIPEMVRYKRGGINFFTNYSDVCRNPIFIEECSGIWLDSFDGLWYDEKKLRELLKIGKPICVVSEELHNRDQSRQWSLLKEINEEGVELFLCTDMPEEARGIFND